MPSDTMPGIVVSLPVTEIQVDDGHRAQRAGKDFERGCAELAESIRAKGVLNPIKVCRTTKGGTRLVFGLRRLTASIMAGLDEIPAIVSARPMSDQEVEAERLSENLDRENPSPIDEMVGVVALYEAELRAICESQLGADVDETDPVVQDELHGRAVEAVAARMNRSARWVRDRLYLRRLSPKVAEKVIAGEIGLLHARELAKLGDHRAQEQLAVECRRAEDGTGAIAIDRLAGAVGRRLTRLEGVVWRLEVPFAGKPACTGCPDNSGTDAQLFEGGHSPEKAMCLNPACYNAKRKAAEAAVSKSATKVASLIEKGKLEGCGPKVLAERELVPEFVKPTTVAARARQKSGPVDAKGDKPKAEPGAANRPTAERKLEIKAAEAWDTFVCERSKSIDRRIFELLSANPIKLWAMALFEITRPRRAWNQKKPPKPSAEHLQATRLLKSEVADVLAMEEIADLTRSVFAAEVKKTVDVYKLGFEFDYVVDDLAEALVGELPDQAEWIGNWLKEHESPEPGAKGGKTGSKKKSPRKKAGAGS